MSSKVTSTWIKIAILDQVNNALGYKAVIAIKESLDLSNEEFFNAVGDLSIERKATHACGYLFNLIYKGGKTPCSIDEEEFSNEYKIVVVKKGYGFDEPPVVKVFYTSSLQSMVNEGFSFFDKKIASMVNEVDLNELGYDIINSSDYYYIIMRDQDLGYEYFYTVSGKISKNLLSIIPESTLFVSALKLEKWEECKCKGFAHKTTVRRKRYDKFVPAETPKNAPIQAEPSPSNTLMLSVLDKEIPLHGVDLDTWSSLDHEEKLELLIDKLKISMSIKASIL